MVLTWEIGGGGHGHNVGAPTLLSIGMYGTEIIHLPLPYGQAQPGMTNDEEWATSRK